MRINFLKKNFKKSPLTKNFFLSPEKNGQILVLFAFLFLIILGMFIVSLNIGELAKDRIVIQQAADAGAIAAAQSLTAGMEAIVSINNMLAKDFANMSKDVSSVMWIPLFGPIIALAIVISDMETICEGVELTELYLHHYCAPLCQIAAYEAAIANGANVGWAIATDDLGANLNINVHTQNNGLLYRVIQARIDGTFPERAVVVAWNKASQDVPFGASFVNLKTPPMYAISTAGIYYGPAAMSPNYDPNKPFKADGYNGRITSMSDSWTSMSTWISGSSPVWQTRLLPNQDDSGKLPDYLKNEVGKDVDISQITQKTGGYSISDMIDKAKKYYDEFK